MKNIYLYYLAMFAPLLVLIFMFKSHLLPSWLAVGLLLSYVFIYRTFIDGRRLMSKKLIKKDEMWKVATHGLRAKYFKELYLQK